MGETLCAQPRHIEPIRARHAAPCASQPISVLQRCFPRIPCINILSLTVSVLTLSYATHNRSSIILIPQLT